MKIRTSELCLKCGEETVPGSRICPFCGAPLPRFKEQTDQVVSIEPEQSLDQTKEQIVPVHHWVRMVVAVGAVLLAVIFLFLRLTQAPGSQNASGEPQIVFHGNNSSGTSQQNENPPVSWKDLLNVLELYDEKMISIGDCDAQITDLDSDGLPELLIAVNDSDPERIFCCVRNGKISEYRTEGNGRVLFQPDTHRAMVEHSLINQENRDEIIELKDTGFERIAAGTVSSDGSAVLNEKKCSNSESYEKELKKFFDTDRAVSAEPVGDHEKVFAASTEICVDLYLKNLSEDPSFQMNEYAWLSDTGEIVVFEDDGSVVRYLPDEHLQKRTVLHSDMKINVTEKEKEESETYVQNGSLLTLNQETDHSAKSFELVHRANADSEEYDVKKRISRYIGPYVFLWKGNENLSENTSERLDDLILLPVSKRKDLILSEETVPSESDPVQEAKMAEHSVHVMVEDLNIREKPDRQSKSLGHAELDGRYTLFEEVDDGTYTWYRIGEAMWIANNGEWVEKYANEPDDRAWLQFEKSQYTIKTGETVILKLHFERGREFPEGYGTDDIGVSVSGREEILQTENPDVSQQYEKGLVQIAVKGIRQGKTVVTVQEGFFHASTEVVVKE